MITGGDFIYAGGNGHLVLAHDAAAGGAGDMQGAVAVEGDVVLGEYHGVHVVFILGGKAAAVGEGIHRALGQSDKDLVCLLDVDGGIVGAVDAHTVQNQLDLILRGGIHQNIAVVETAGDHVGSWAGNGHHGAGDLHAVGVCLPAGAGEGDSIYSIVIFPGQIPVREKLAGALGAVIAAHGQNRCAGYGCGRCLGACRTCQNAAGGQDQGCCQQQRKEKS